MMKQLIITIILFLLYSYISEAKEVRDTLLHANNFEISFIIGFSSFGEVSPNFRFTDSTNYLIHKNVSGSVNGILVGGAMSWVFHTDSTFSHRLSLRLTYSQADNGITNKYNTQSNDSKDSFTTFTHEDSYGYNYSIISLSPLYTVSFWNDRISLIAGPTMNFTISNKTNIKKYTLIYRSNPLGNSISALSNDKQSRFNTNSVQICFVYGLSYSLKLEFFDLNFFWLGGGSQVLDKDMPWELGYNQFGIEARF